ncbi:AIR synthase related protein, partial [Elusimicrobiota bacterium]
MNRLDITCLEENQLAELSRNLTLSLSVDEMNAVKGHFKDLGREPTLTELEIIAQTWSEHCKHKTMGAQIEYIEQTPDGTVISTEKINNLLKETIFRVTKTLDKDYCLSVFEDNAGIIEFDDEHAIAMKAETHNHPCAIEPYGGATTGIGGVIRDILGCGNGARPVMNIDVFCFGPQDYPHEKLPEGVLHPKRVFKGVIKGVRDYGNRMGIPTSSGAIFFDESYIFNPL